MRSGPGSLEVNEIGATIVVGFRGRVDVDPRSINMYRQQLEHLVNIHGCESITFVLTDVPIVSSQTLGLMFHLSTLGPQVRLYEPSRAVRDLLSMTQLNRVLTEVKSVA